MSEMRFDPVGRSWVVIAPERGERPADFLPPPPAVSGGPCPLCLASEDGDAIARRDVGDDAVRVIANRFPALRVEHTPRRRAVGPYDQVTGVGAHEVVIETTRHDVALESASVDQIGAVLLTWRDRVSDLMRDRRVHYVTVFKNAGPLAGASVPHAHSQIIAAPVRPTRLAAELDAAREHFFAKERCLACDVVDFELEARTRVVEVTERYAAFCPYASRHPFEVRIYPRGHEHDYTGLSDGGARELAGLLGRTLRRLRTALRGASYNLGLHTAPSLSTYARAHHDIDGMDLFWHWRLEVVPRIRSHDGFVVAAGVHVNPVAPEDAAAHLRSVDADPAPSTAGEEGPRAR